MNASGRYSIAVARQSFCASIGQPRCFTPMIWIGHLHIPRLCPARLPR
jgi:hypothetical protein